MKADKLLSGMRRMILQLFPEFGGYHLPIKGKVVKLHGDAGDVGVTNGPRRYSVDVEPLLPDGSKDELRSIIKDVALDVPWTGTARGVFSLPKEGSLVRLAFYGGSAAHPYIDGVIPDGNDVVAVEDGQYLVQHRDGSAFWFDPDGNLHIELAEEGGSGANIDIKLKGSANGKLTVKVDGDVNVETKKKMTIKAQQDVLIETATTATIKAAAQVNLGSIGGQPVARLGDQIVATGIGNMGAPVASTGTIISGSTKVFSS